MSRYVASHYFLYRESALSPDEKETVRRALPSLRPLPAEEIARLFATPLYQTLPPSGPFGPFPPPFPPEEYAGFSQCRIGLSADGRLLSLQPFTGEAESTEWYPGVLAYSPAFPL